MSQTPLMVFDIETIPDVTTGKALYGIDSDNEDDALQALIAARHAEAGNDFMRHPLHKVACLSFLWIQDDSFILKSLSLENMSEAEILSTFVRAFGKYPTLISWNGASFDLPVLMYRLTHHGIDAKPIFGRDYLYRYSKSHIDMMDKFSFGVWSNKQKLNTIAALCGYAGKGDIDGSQVLPMVQAGEWDILTTYCESDVINTWFIYLRYLQLTGNLSAEAVASWLDTTKAYLATLIDEAGNCRHQHFLDN